MTALARLNVVKDMVLTLVFPRRCLACGSGGDFLCASCRSSLPHILPPVCDRCGAPGEPGASCIHCQKLSPALWGVRSLLSFEGLGRQIVHELKYHNFKALAGPLGELLADYFLANRLAADVLVPVPLHPSRLRERGYNQSALLAREMGRRLSIPVLEKGLTRVRHTQPQAKAADALQRRHNVRGAFGCREKTFVGKRVLLIDDVCTTGATLEACAVALQAAGAVSVWGLTLARER